MCKRRPSIGRKTVLTGPWYGAGLAAKYAVMKTLRLEYPVIVLCRVFGVSRSVFYACANAKPSQRTQEDARLKIAIEGEHAQSRPTCGQLRTQPALTAQACRWAVTASCVCVANWPALQAKTII
jgi:hypothetical protein